MLGEGMTKRVLSYGEVLWDLLPEGPVLGGALCNLACRVQEALLVSRVGDDELGREARAQMQRLGLDTKHVQTDPAHPTGVVNITLDAQRQPGYEIVPEVAYDFIAFNDALREAARCVDCICYGTLSQRNACSR